jgi:hypothetical protein
MFFHGFHSIVFLFIYGFAEFGGINSQKFKVLLVSPVNRLMATHFIFHQELANSFASNKHVEKVVRKLLLIL